MGWLLLAALAVLVVVLLRDLGRVAEALGARQRRHVLRTRLEEHARHADATSPGGIPENPVSIRSPSVVEAHARRQSCVVCGSEHEVEEHEVLQHRSERLRVARVRCRGCGRRRELFYRVQPTHLN